MKRKPNRNAYGWLAIVPPWTFSVVIFALIIWLTLGQPPSPPDDIQLWEHTDKIVHAVMFGALFGAMALDWYRRHPMQQPYISSSVMFTIFPWVLVVSAVIELVQPTFGRSNDVMDFLADAAGALLAWMITPPILRAMNK